jgi:hypothetical protein
MGAGTVMDEVNTELATALGFCVVEVVEETDDEAMLGEAASIGFDIGKMDDDLYTEGVVVVDELHEVLCFSCCALLGVTEVEPEGPEFCATCRRTESECFTCPVKQECYDGTNINGPCITEVV